MKISQLAILLICLSSAGPRECQIQPFCGCCDIHSTFAIRDHLHLKQFHTAQPELEISLFVFIFFSSANIFGNRCKRIVSSLDTDLLWETVAAQVFFTAVSKYVGTRKKIETNNKISSSGCAIWNHFTAVLQKLGSRCVILQIRKCKTQQNLSTCHTYSSNCSAESLYLVPLLACPRLHKRKAVFWWHWTVTLILNPVMVRRQTKLIHRWTTVTMLSIQGYLGVQVSHTH